MNSRRAGIALLIAVVVGIAGWFGWRAWQDRAATPAPSAGSSVTLPVPGGADNQTGDEVQFDTGPVEVVVEGTTPMAERVAVLGLLNKRNSQTWELTMRPGQSLRYGDAVVHLRACERTAPWEPDQLTGAFVQLDVRQADGRWARAFSGWLYAEQPALNVVQHPLFDVFPKSCAMTFPEGGEELGGGTSGSSAPSRSSARQSPSTDGEPEESPAEEAPSAELSNAI